VISAGAVGRGLLAIGDWRLARARLGTQRGPEGGAEFGVQDGGHALDGAFGGGRDLVAEAEVADLLAGVQGAADVGLVEPVGELEGVKGGFAVRIGVWRSRREG
jgi:hypothetical protein